MPEWKCQQPLGPEGACAKQITTIGIDLAKNVFQIHGADQRGKAVLHKQFRRDKVAPSFANLPLSLIGIEAWGSAHQWSRKLQALGHTTRLKALQFVQPYVKSNKNDVADAEAICEAAGRPTMRSVPIKNAEQQSVVSLHFVRQGFVKARAAQANQGVGASIPVLTLSQLEQVESLTGAQPSLALADHSFRGVATPQGTRLLLRYTPGLPPALKKLLNCRHATEPPIRHKKTDGLLARNFHKGSEGDAIHAVYCGKGHNLRLSMAHLRVLPLALIVLTGYASNVLRATWQAMTTTLGAAVCLPVPPLSG